MRMREHNFKSILASGLFIVLLIFCFAKVDVASAKDILFGTSTDRIIITGSLGIGTTAPGYSLDINGVAASRSYFLAHSNPAGSGLVLQNNGAGANLAIAENSAGNYSLGFNAAIGAAISPVLTWTSGGNVGIGTTTPTQKLHVAGNAKVDTLVYSNSPGVSDTYALTTVEYVNAKVGGSGGIAIGTAGQTLRHNGTSWIANSILYNNGANIGIGTTAPTAKLQVSGDYVVLDKNKGFVLDGFNAGGRNRIWGVSTVYPDYGFSYFEGTPDYIGFHLSGNASASNFGISGAGSVSIGNILFRQALDVTGNAIISGNVGIGTTTPTAKLEIGGAGTYSILASNARIGNVATPFAATDAANKSYVDSTISGGAGSTVGYWTMNGTNINNSNAGNVGIGTTTPTEKLEVNGNIKLSGATSYINYGQSWNSGAFTIRNNNTAILSLSATGNQFNTGPLNFAASANYTLGTSDNYALAFKTNNTEKMRIDNLGNVGIGLTNPGHKLVVAGTGASDTGVLGIDVSGAGTWKWASSAINPDMTAGNNLIHMIGQAESSKNAGYIGFNYQGNSSNNNFLTFGLHSVDNVLNITGGGNVGIGTTTPTAKLEIDNAGTYSILADNQRIGNVATPFASTDAATKGYVDGAFAPGGSSSLWSGTKDGTIWNGAAGAGNVGIGTTNPGYNLDIVSANNAHLRLSGGNTGYTDADVILQANTDTDYRGLGTFLYQAISQKEWYIGSPYADADSIIIARQTGLATHNSNTAQNVNALLKITGSGNVGIGTTAPLGKLDVATGNGLALVFGSDVNATTRTTLVQKFGRIGMPHYDLAEEPIILFTADSQASLTRLNFGGGTSAGNAATELNFYTATNTASVLGANRMKIDSSGNVGIGTTTPTAKLEIGGAGTYSILASNARIGNVATPFAATDAANKSYVDSTISGGAGSTVGYWTMNGTNINNSNAGNVGIGVTNPGAKIDIASGIVRQSGYLVSDAATNNLLVNGDFEMGDKYGWNTGSVVAGGYSGNSTLQITGNGSLENNDYIPVDPTKDIFQLEAWVKKSVAGTTPGVLYFGYYAYDANKTLITSAPCGTYCYFAASGYVIPVDGAWHKVSATTVGEGTSYPNFPVGTRYVKILGLVNYSGSADSVTQIDHITLQRLIKGPLIAGNNFSSSNLTDQNQYSTLYTTASNNLIISPPGSGNVGIGITNPGAKLEIGAGNVFLPLDSYIRFGNDVARFGKMPTGTNAYGFYTPTKDFEVQGFNGSSFTQFFHINTNGTSADGNVGIGTTTPTAKLEIGNAGTYSLLAGNQRIGNVATPFASTDAATKGYVDGAFAPGGSSSLWSGTKDGTIWNGAAGAGNVGIGVTNPAEKLWVEGNVRLNSNNPYISIRETSYGQDWSLKVSSVDRRFSILGDDMASEPFTILTSGNVGIGTTTPSQKLDVIGTIKGSVLTDGIVTWNSAQFNRATGNIEMQWSGSGGNGIRFFGNTAYPIIFNGSGNVGIGTTTPTAKLEIGGAGTYSILASNARIGNVATPFAATDAANKSYVDSTISGGAGSTVGYWTMNGTNINNSNAGNVGIGTTNPFAKLEVSGGDIYVFGGTNRRFLVGDSASAGQYGGFRWQSSDDSISFGHSNSSTDLRNIAILSNGNILLDAGITGNVGIGTTAPASKLDINHTTNGPASATYSTTAANANIVISANPTTNTKLFGGIGDGNYTWLQAQNSDNSLKILSLNPLGGNVGIGTTTPTAKLEIGGAGTYSILASNARIGNVATPFAATDAATKGYVDGAFAPGGSSSLWSGTKDGTIWNGTAGLGNVGIGTSTPVYKLDIDGTFEATTNSSSIRLDASGNVLIGI